MFSKNFTVVAVYNWWGSGGGGGIWYYTVLCTVNTVQIKMFQEKLTTV